MKLAKIIAVGLSAVMLTTGFSVSALAAQTTESTVSTPGFKTYDALYAHAVLNSEDTQSWLRWQSVHDENFNEIDSNKKYFFLPSSANGEKVDIYNAYSSPITINGVTIDSHKSGSIPYNTNVEYKVNAGGKNFTLIFMKSTASPPYISIMTMPTVTVRSLSHTLIVIRVIPQAQQPQLSMQTVQLKLPMLRK